MSHIFVINKNKTKGQKQKQKQNNAQRGKMFYQKTHNSYVIT